jgi:F-type H+-transporting ATPase subunit b
MQIISNIALISINETLVVQLISFLIFLFIINRIMIRPLRETMTERDHYIQLVQRDTLDARKQLEAVVAASRQEEHDIRQTAFQIVAEMEDLGNQEAQDLVGVARDEIADQKRQSHAEIERHLSEAMTTVQDEAQALSVSIMEKVLNRKVAT